MDRAVRAFSAWMDGAGSGSLIWFGLVAVLLSPLLVLIHELGHAAVGLARTEGLVAVRVGRSPARWRFRLGRLYLELNPLPARNAPAGLAAVHARYGAGTRLLLVLAGPLAEAAAAVAVAWIGVLVHLQVLMIVGAIGVLDAVLNLVPREVYGYRSDGAHALAVLRRRRHHSQGAEDGHASDVFAKTFAAVSARWLVLYTAAGRTVGTQRRGELLDLAAVAAGYTRRDHAAGARALWRLAFAGWCWREAERGDFRRIRDAALDADLAATVSGAVEPHLTALAARNLATGDADLALASPGRTDDERRLFLATAFQRLPAPLRATGLPDDHQQFAFRYGVALRDIERARG